MLQSEKVFKNISEWKKEKQWQQVENYQQRKTVYNQVRKNYPDILLITNINRNLSTLKCILNIPLEFIIYS